MAITTRGTALTEAHRVLQAQLSAQTVAALVQVWPLLDVRDLDATFDRWLTAVRPLVRQQRAASAAIARRYQRQFRSIELNDRLDAFTPPPPVPLDDNALTTSLLVQGPVKIKTLTAAGRPIADASSTASLTSSVAAARHVLDGGRTVLLETARTDPAARGARRVCAPNCCAFCAMLAARSYHGLSAAAFKAHDGCACQPETAYSSGPAAATRQAREFAALYDESTTGVAGGRNQRNAFRRALAAQRAT